MKELILIVDDEPGILTTLSHILEDEGFETIATGSGEEALELYRHRRPAAVFLDVWLPDRDGLEALAAIRELDPEARVIMISGHGTTRTAVKAIKMGAFDYLEKPLSYDRTVETLRAALADLSAPRPLSTAFLEMGAEREELERPFAAPPLLPIVRETDLPQRTIAAPGVIYGHGLHSGTRTGMALRPLPPGSGVHFLTLPSGTAIPAHLSAVGETEYATTLTREGEEIRTVEHLLSALHALGVTNLLVKVHGEIPVLDGSAVELVRKLEEIGVVEQDAPRREVVIDRRYALEGPGDKLLVIEPAERLEVSYHLRYPPPIGEQFFHFVLTSPEAYREEIAPARTFGFMRDLKMLGELGLGAGGRLDNFILVGEDNVINTELRWPDEFVRHKILDIIGDLYLLGYPLRGKVTARFTGHRDNIAIGRAILAAHQGYLA